MSGSKYRTGKHHPMVKQAAVKSGIRIGGIMVLDALLTRAEYDRPEVTIKKAKIHDLSGLERKAIQRGLAALRKHGVIEPIADFAGGRGVGVTYRLHVVGQGGDTSSDAGEGSRKCPPEMFSDWHKRLGISEAMRLKALYEAGEDPKE